jgi:NADH-quinone oxidoreductase subunit A
LLRCDSLPHGVFQIAVTELLACKGCLRHVGCRYIERIPADRCVLARQKPDSEKNSAYECGFPPFGDARSKFDVRFYLVAILFIIFDLEIAFLFPWAISLGKIGVYGFWSMMVFLAVLTVGFIYEWRKGALEWD